MSYFLTRHTRQISSLQKFLIRGTKFADTFGQCIASSLVIDWLFFESSSQQFHHIFSHQLKSMMSTPPKPKNLQPGNRFTPRREIRARLKLLPLAQDHNVGFLKNFFGVSCGSDQRQNKQID
jgi:hypothetical protein